MNNYFVRMTFLQPTLFPLKTYSTMAKPYKGYERSKRETCSQARLIDEDNDKNVTNLNVFKQ